MAVRKRRARITYPSSVCLSVFRSIVFRQSTFSYQWRKNLQKTVVNSTYTAAITAMAEWKFLIQPAPEGLYRYFGTWSVTHARLLSFEGKPFDRRVCAICFGLDHSVGVVARRQCAISSSALFGTHSAYEHSEHFEFWRTNELRRVDRSSKRSGKRPTRREPYVTIVMDGFTRATNNAILL